MKFLIGMLAAVVLFQGSFANALVDGHIEISPSHKVFYKYEKAEKNKPTMVLLNGLIYSLDNWEKYVSLLVKRGYGVVQIAYSTQPESLKLLEEMPYFEKTTMTHHGPRQAGIETQGLVNEVKKVINHLGVDKYHLLSLSYGSVVASELAVQDRRNIKSLIFVAPAVLPSHRYQAYGESRHQFYLYQKKINTNPFYDPDYYYDAEMYQSMFAIISAQSSTSRPTGIPFLTFFHGVYQMARSTKWFDLKSYASAKLPPVHLFLASKEEVPLFKDQTRFWRLLADNRARRSRVLFRGGYHALPGVSPEITAKVTAQVIEGEIKSGEHEVVVK